MARESSLKRVSLDGMRLTSLSLIILDFCNRLYCEASSFFSCSFFDAKNFVVYRVTSRVISFRLFLIVFSVYGANISKAFSYSVVYSPPISSSLSASLARSEERRVGKECRL